MDYLELAKLCGAVAVPIVVVAGLFYAIMVHNLRPVVQALPTLAVRSVRGADD